VAFPAVSFPPRNGAARKVARGGKPEGSRNKRSVALASLIAVSPPAFEQKDSSSSLGEMRGRGQRARQPGIGARARSEGESRQRLAGRAALHVRTYARVFMGILQESPRPRYTTRDPTDHARSLKVKLPP